MEDSSSKLDDAIGRFVAPEFLASLPPEFVASLPLSALMGEQSVATFLGDFYLAIGGDKEAEKRCGGPFPKKEIREARRGRTKEECRKIGRWFLENKSDVNNSLLFGLIINKVEEFCARFIDQGVSNRQAFIALPEDVLVALDAATECLAATAFISLLSATTTIQGQSWESNKRLAGALKRLKAATSQLRSSITPIAQELAAANANAVFYKSMTYASSHHAIFASASNVLEIIALAQNEGGASVLLGGIGIDSVAAVEATKYSDCFAVAAGLLKLPFPELLPLLTSAQQEACRVSEARKQSGPRALQFTCDAALNQQEKNILEAVGAGDMSGAELAKAAGYPFTGRFRETLASMKKRNLLTTGKHGRGYQRGERAGQ